MAQNRSATISAPSSLGGSRLFDTHDRAPALRDVGRPTDAALIDEAAKGAAQNIFSSGALTGRGPAQFGLAVTNANQFDSRPGVVPARSLARRHDRA